MDNPLYITPNVKKACEIAVKDDEFVNEILNADPLAPKVLSREISFMDLPLYYVYTGWVLARRGKDEYQKL